MSKALRVVAAGTGLYFFLAATSCTGFEADVLALRPVPDLATGSPGHPPADAAVSSCTTQTLNSPACVEFPVWLGKAQAVCSELDLIPGGIELIEPCAPMQGQGIRFQCCPPPPPPPLCTQRLQGTEVSCLDAKTWLDSATLDCQLRKEKVMLLALLEPCAPRSYRQVKYMCCAEPWVPPVMTPLAQP